jgi:pSer/pThr/pTyr-binding forkhead associated (FHA) protein
MSKTYNLIVSIPGEAEAHYSLSARQILIGRSTTCPITVDATPVSSLHCELTLTAEGYTVADSGSRNGTKVNGANIDSAPVLLRNGDLVLLGESATAKFIEVAQVAEIADEPDPRDEEPMINPVAAAVASATQKMKR